MKLAYIVSIAVVPLMGSALLRGDSASGAEESSRNSPPPSAQPDRAPITAPEINAISALTVKTAKFLDQINDKMRRSLRRVPTDEEFRVQVADGRREIERRRAAVSARWAELKRLADARQVKIDAGALRNSVPEELKDDADFLAIRARALEENRLVGELEERLIDVMLTTGTERAGPAPQSMPHDSAIAREKENLAATQKALTSAVQNAQRLAAAAKVEFDPSRIFRATLPENQAGEKALLQAIERARAQMRARDASAELLAELEFMRAVGPLEENW